MTILLGRAVRLRAMLLQLWGIDFRRGAHDLRAKLYLPKEERPALLEKVKALGFQDLIYFATCNRVEFYTTANHLFEDHRHHWARLLDLFGLDSQAYYSGYHMEGKSAVRHLCRVASSLESMVVGESQVLGQLKEAFQLSEERGECRPSLRRAFQFAFAVAKEIRTLTALGEGSCSVANLAFRAIETSPLAKEHLVVVGRGPMSQLAVKWWQRNFPAGKLTWVNRSIEKLDRMEGVNYRALGDFIEQPETFTHLITSTASREPIFDDRFASRLSTPARLIDLAEPPDFHFSGSYPHLELLLIESFQGEAAKNAEGRKEEIAKAETKIESALKEFFLEQKQAPLMKDFSQVEPHLFVDFEVAVEDIAEYLPVELVPKVKKWGEKLVKRNLHLSREHLKGILEKVSEGSLE